MKDCKSCFAVNISTHEYTEQTIYTCEIADKGVGNLSEIPAWCPLKILKGLINDETDMERS